MAGVLDWLGTANTTSLHVDDIGRAVRGRDGGRLIAGDIVGGGITEEVAGKMLPVFAFSVTLPVNRWERR
jgi:hypothetical protein